MPFHLYSNDSVNWQPYKKNIDKPVFMLLTTDLNNKTDNKIFQNKRLVKLLNENFYSIKVDINENIDFKNRFLFMSPPSIAILNEKGIIITKKRNYSTLTIERDLYNYLESLKNKSIRKMLDKITREAMYKTYYSAYFFENTKNLIDRTNEIKNFVINEINFDTMFFKISFMKPLYDYAFSILNIDNKEPYLKLILESHIDSLLEGKIFNKDHIFKASYNDWNKPIKNIIYKDNIKLMEILNHIGNFNIADKITLYLNKNYQKLTTEEKILLSTRIITKKFTEEELNKIKNLIKNNNNSKYLNERIAIFKAYLSIYKYDKDILTEFLEFINKLEKDFYDEEKGVFYDVKINTEPFGFKFVDLSQNIELAYLYTLLYDLTSDFDNLVTAKYILSFMNKTSIDNLIYSKYVIAIDNLNKAEKKLLEKE
jgi:hypothetical protein